MGLMARVLEAYKTSRFAPRSVRERAYIALLDSHLLQYGFSQRVQVVVAPMSDDFVYASFAPKREHVIGRPERVVLYQSMIDTLTRDAVIAGEPAFARRSKRASQNGAGGLRIVVYDESVRPAVTAFCEEFSRRFKQPYDIQQGTN